MGVVSFRIPDETAAVLRHAGRNPAEVARQAVLEEAQRVRESERWALIARHRLRTTKSAADLVRESREDLS